MRVYLGAFAENDAVLVQQIHLALSRKRTVDAAGVQIVDAV